MLISFLSNICSFVGNTRGKCGTESRDKTSTLDLSTVIIHLPIAHKLLKIKTMVFFHYLPWLTSLTMNVAYPSPTYLSINPLVPELIEWTNNIDTYQQQHNAASDQDLCCKLCYSAKMLSTTIRVANIIEPDQMQCWAAADLVLYDVCKSDVCRS